MADTTVEEFVRSAGSDAVDVITADPLRLSELVRGPGVEVVRGDDPEHLRFSGISARDIGTISARHGLRIFELTPQSASLEEAFLDLTRESVEFHGTTDHNFAGSNS